MKYWRNVKEILLLLLVSSNQWMKILLLINEEINVMSINVWEKPMTMRNVF